MKTFVRLIRRYVLAAVGIVLLLLFSGVAVLGWLGWQEGCRLPQREYSSSEIADSMVETAEGLAFGGRTHPAGVDEWLRVGDGAGRCGKHPLELRPAAGTGPCLHSRRYRQICPLVSGRLPGVLLDRTLWTVRHRAAKGEPVEVQHLQLTGLCPEHGAGAPGSSAGNAAAGSGALLLAELAGGQSGWRPWQTVWKRWRRGRPFNCLRMVLPGNWQKS